MKDDQIKELKSQIDSLSDKYRKAINVIINLNDKITALELQINQQRDGYVISDKSEIDEWKGDLNAK